MTIGEQRAAGLCFADPRVQGLLHVLLFFLLVQATFRNKDLREHIAPLLGMEPSQLSPGRVTYDLRRLRLHGLIERIPKTHCYCITAKGLRTAIFYTQVVAEVADGKDAKNWTIMDQDGHTNVQMCFARKSSNSARQESLKLRSKSNDSSSTNVFSLQSVRYVRCGVSVDNSSHDALGCCKNHRR